MTDRLQQRYEQHHREHERYGFSHRRQERGPQFSAWIGTGKRILDLGCRDGVLTQYYAQGNAVTGVDIDQQALDMAKERLGIATLWLDLNRSTLPFANGSFDVVVAGEVLEHLAHPAALVSEIVRALSPIGALVGSVPNSYHWRARLACLKGYSNEDPTHLHRFSRSTILALLGGFGEAKSRHLFGEVELLAVGGIGGRMLPVVPRGMSQPLVNLWPALFASDFLFRAKKRRP